jgi:hypothetical protein
VWRTDKKGTKILGKNYIFLKLMIRQTQRAEDEVTRIPTPVIEYKPFGK